MVRVIRRSKTNEAIRALFGSFLSILTSITDALVSISDALWRRAANIALLTSLSQLRGNAGVIISFGT